MANHPGVNLLFEPSALFGAAKYNQSEAFAVDLAIRIKNGEPKMAQDASITRMSSPEAVVGEVVG